MPSLWELSNEYVAALAAIGASENPEDDFVALEAIQDTWENKVENCGKAIIDLLADAAKAKAGEARLKARRKDFERNVAKIKGWLHDEMTRTGRDRVHTADVTVGLRKSLVSCDIFDASSVPEGFKETVLTEKIDKNAMIAQYKLNGEDIPGAFFITDARTVQIK